MSFGLEFEGANQFFAEILRAGEIAAAASVRRVGAKAFKLVKSATPKDSGNTRAAWKMIRSDKSVTLKNASPGIVKLEFGGFGKGPKTTNPKSTPDIPMKRFVSKKAPGGILRVTLKNLDKIGGVFETDMDGELQMRFDQI